MHFTLARMGSSYFYATKIKTVLLLRETHLKSNVLPDQHRQPKHYPYQKPVILKCIIFKFQPQHIFSVNPSHSQTTVFTDIKSLQSKFKPTPKSRVVSNQTCDKEEIDLNLVEYSK